MNFVLLITITFSLAFAQAVNYRPCQPNRFNNAYSNFVKRHIVQTPFNRNSPTAWKEYISSKGLCSRPVQSFMEESAQGLVEQICNGSGYQVVNGRNLCISNRPFLVYELRVTTSNCKVRILPAERKRLVVACDAVANQCRPVHFEKLTNQRRNNAVRCR